MNKLIAVAAAAVALTGCAANFDQIERPPEGYAAIRLKRQVIVPIGALRGDITFPAGTLLVADRRSKDGRAIYYCGIGVMNGGPASSACVEYDQKSFAITLTHTGERYVTAISSDDVLETRN